MKLLYVPSGRKPFKTSHEWKFKIWFYLIKVFRHKPHIHYNLTDGIWFKFPIQAVPSEMFAHVLPLNIDAWVQTVGSQSCRCCSSREGMFFFLIFLLFYIDSCRSHCIRAGVRRIWLRTILSCNDDGRRSQRYRWNDTQPTAPTDSLFHAANT